MSLLNEYILLLQGGPPPSGFRANTLSPGIDVAVDRDGTRLLIIDMGTDPVVVKDRRSAGVWLTSTPDGVGRRRLFVECREPALQDVFTAMAERLTDALDGVPPHNRRTVTQGHLERWRRMLSPAPSDRISEEAEVGLLGELTVLREFAGSDPNVALDAWRGPTGSQYDFQWAAMAVEVKTTRAREGFTVSVHGLHQLEPPEGTDLHLVGVRVTKSPTGRTLPETVSSLLELVDGAVLLPLLEGIGYVHGDAGSHEWERWAIGNMACWPVTDDSPGLRASALPPGWINAISAVNYHLELSAFGAPLDAADVAAIWETR
jgi:hypothetical protein